MLGVHVRVQQVRVNARRTEDNAMSSTAKRPSPDISRPPLTVSLATLARVLDAGRSSVRRWLRQAGIRPIAMSDGPRSAIRYRWKDVQAWLESREHVA